MTKNERLKQVKISADFARDPLLHLSTRIINEVIIASDVFDAAYAGATVGEIKQALGLTKAPKQPRLPLLP